MPPAARITDMHTCPMVNPGPVPHVGGPVSQGSPDVIIGFQPAARVGDTAVCVPAVDTIAMGASNVLVNNKMAARLGDQTSHGGVIVIGCPTVLIGTSSQAFALAGAAKTGAPFCEECEKAKKAAEEKAKQDAAGQASSPVTGAPSPEETKAAASEGDTPAQRAAREKVARNFYETHCPEMSLADIDSHVRCVDLAHPVEVVHFPTDGKERDELWQHTKPGSVGQYFALDPHTTANQLGAHSHVLMEGKSGASDVVVPREQKKFSVTKDAPVHGLKSRAAPAKDTWSNKHDPKHVPGGGTQVMIPRKQHHAIQKH